MDGLRITISPLFSLNLGYPLPFMQGFYNFQDSQNIKLGQYVEGGGFRYGKPRYKQSIQDI